MDLSLDIWIIIASYLAKADLYHIHFLNKEMLAMMNSDGFWGKYLSSIAMNRGITVPESKSEVIQYLSINHLWRQKYIFSSINGTRLGELSGRIKKIVDNYILMENGNLYSIDDITKRRNIISQLIDKRIFGGSVGALATDIDDFGVQADRIAVLINGVICCSTTKSKTSLSVTPITNVDKIYSSGRSIYFLTKDRGLISSKEDREIRPDIVPSIIEDNYILGGGILYINHDNYLHPLPYGDDNLSIKVIDNKPLLLKRNGSVIDSNGKIIVAKDIAAIGILLGNISLIDSKGKLRCCNSDIKWDWNNVVAVAKSLSEWIVITHG